MNRSALAAGIAGVALALLFSGCRLFEGPFEELESGNLEYYRGVATRVEFPIATEPSAVETTVFSGPPRRIRDLHDPDQEQIWDVSLAEIIQIAVTNSQMIRTRGGFLSAQNPLLTNPQLTTSVYDPAIQESGVLLGNRGVEEALSDFDAVLTTNMQWGRNELVQNNRLLSGGLDAGQTLTDETGVFNSRLEKQMATGGLFALRHDWNYSQNNVPGRLFPSAYTGLLGAEYRHPLWAGSGTEFTRIAGPANSGVQRISGVDQGVVISRINNDISLADLEFAVTGLVKEVEELYWELSLAYRVYDSEKTAHQAATALWQVVEAKASAELISSADEAQARDNYFQTQFRAENALADLYQFEGRLRRLIGLPVSDGRILRPVDEPITAEFLPDWYVCLAESLVRRVELRRQKWNIKSFVLQLKAAKNLTRPQLDFVSDYRVNAFGDRLLGENDDDGITSQGLHSAYETLTEGDQTGWTMGFQFSMPFGFRTANARVRNTELRLAKARAALAAQELEISHELSHAFRELDRWYILAQTNLNRRLAAQQFLETVEIKYEEGHADTTLDLLVRAQTSLSEAEISYARSLIAYSQAISGISYRKGTLLEDQNVHMAENHWTPAAYRDAYRRAWARSHAPDNRHLRTAPIEFVAGPDDMPFKTLSPIAPPVGLHPPLAESDANASLPSPLRHLPFNPESLGWKPSATNSSPIAVPTRSAPNSQHGQAWIGPEPWEIGR